MGDSPTAASAWQSTTILVTLPSGNTARLRAALPVYTLLRTGLLDAESLRALEKAQQGELDDPELAVRLVDVVCEAMFVEPRVTAAGENGSVAVDDLDQDDVDRVLELAFGGTPDDGFPERANGAGNGENSEVLGAKPKSAARPRARKPAGAGSRSAAR